MLKYVEIENEIRKRIKNGYYAIGEHLPDQNQMAKEFKTTRVTVQKALKNLINEDLIYSQRGSGTYVKANAKYASKFDFGVDQYVGTTQFLGKNHKIASKIIKFKIRYPNADEKERLNLKKNDLVYDIKRLRIVDDEPYAFEYTKMPVNIIPGIDESVLKKSIYGYINQTLNKKIGAAYRIISANKPNQDDQKYLECKKDDPVLLVNQVVFLKDGTPFEYSETHHPYNKGKITVYVSGNNR